MPKSKKDSEQVTSNGKGKGKDKDKDKGKDVQVVAAPSKKATTTQKEFNIERLSDPAYLSKKLDKEKLLSRLKVFVF